MLDKQLRTSSLTIDVEEYFQVEAFANDVNIQDWEKFESRIEFQIDILLELLEEKKVHATFFVLGVIAEKHPGVVNKIIKSGHELASHGYNHQHISKQSQKEFVNDITQAKKLLEDLSSTAVLGYRAPCFSIAPDNEWAHDEILNAGYSYSSSTYPIIHDFYGVPNAPRTPYYLQNKLLEIPVSTCKFRNKALPAGGGGFFRLLPFFIYSKMLKSSFDELEFLNFYTHPWEYDPKQPKIKSSFKSSFRHRVNQHSALFKLGKLCEQYKFDTLANIHLNKEYPSLGDWTHIAAGER